MLQYHDPIPLHIYTETGRFYKVGESRFPGVGTVLTATESPEQKAYWEQWRSNPENVAKSEAAKARGTLFHAAVEHHLNQQPFLSSSFSDQVPEYWESIQPILPRISDPLLIESAVWHEVGYYAGTVDLVASFDEQPVILDWKTATKPKQPEWTERYGLQLAAYCACVNRMYNLKIRRGVIVVALPDQCAQVFEFDLCAYWKRWLQKLCAYWESQPDGGLALEGIKNKYKL